MEDVEDIKHSVFNVPRSGLQFAATLQYLHRGRGSSMRERRGSGRGRGHQSVPARGKGVVNKQHVGSKSKRSCGFQALLVRIDNRLYDISDTLEWYVCPNFLFAKVLISFSLVF